VIVTGTSTGVDAHSIHCRRPDHLSNASEHSAKRAQFSRACLPVTGQSAGGEFRPNKDEYARGLFGRTIRALAATSPWMARTTTTKWSAERSRTFRRTLSKSFQIATKPL